MIYQGIEYKKHQRVKFVIPTDFKIIDPQTEEIIWKYGKIQFFSKKTKSAWILEDNADKNIQISLFCILPVN